MSYTRLIIKLNANIRLIGAARGLLSFLGALCRFPAGPFPNPTTIMKFFAMTARVEHGPASSSDEAVTFEIRPYAMEPWKLNGMDAHRTYLAVIVKLWNEFSLDPASRPKARAIEDGVELAGPDGGAWEWGVQLQVLSDKLFAELAVSGVESLYDVDRLVRRLHLPRPRALANAS